MFTINRIYSHGIFFLVTASLFLIACKKETPPKYAGDDFVYIMNLTPYGITPDVKNIQNFYLVQRQFSFLSPANQMDTIFFNRNTSFPFVIQMDGRLSDRDRKVKVEIEGTGKEFVVLPHEDSIYIPANKTELVLNLKLVRPPLSDTALKKMTVVLKNNEEFSPENHVWHKANYLFGNWFNAPAFYTNQENIFGAFSAAKMYAMEEAVNKAGAQFWQTNTSVIALNANLKGRGVREVKFHLFSFNELYYYLELPITIGSQQNLPVVQAYNAVNTKIVQLAKALLLEKKQAGTPIRDAAGTEISFPE